MKSAAIFFPSFRQFAIAVVAVLSGLAMLASAALADTTVTASQTVAWSGQGANASGIPDSCSNTEFLFVLNGISADTAAHVPQSISVTFTNNTTVTFPLTSLQGNLGNGAGNAHYSIAVTPSNGNLGIKAASFVVPTGMTSYNQFVLSHGGRCRLLAPSPPPPPGATPELGSLLLFGTGVLGAAGYALTRRRARR